MEYIIIENTEKYGWCLWRVCGKDYEWAQQVLRKEQEAHPDKEFRIETVNEDCCWWNDDFLST